MRPFGILRAVSWQQAVAEVVLIVVGISLALGAQAWWDYRSERQDEVALLSQVRETLITDRDSLQSEVDRADERASLLGDLRTHLQLGLPYADSLSEYFSPLRYWQTSNVNKAPYEDLKSRGLHVVSNQRLRLMLIDYFERALPVVEDRDRIDRTQTMEYSTSVLQHHMRWIDSFYVPVDYERSLASPEFMYMVRHRSGGVRNTSLLYHDFLDETDTLIAALGMDLGIS